MMVVSNSMSSIHNRNTYTKINKPGYTHSRIGKNLLDLNEPGTKPVTRVKIKDTIEVKEKIWMHTENWLG